MTSKKNIGITHANHSATPKAILTKMQKCTWKLNVHIFIFCFALVIIHGDRYDYYYKIIMTKLGYCLALTSFKKIGPVSISMWSTHAVLSVARGLRTVCTFWQYAQSLQRADRALWINWVQYCAPKTLSLI